MKRVNLFILLVAGTLLFFGCKDKTKNEASGNAETKSTVTAGLRSANTDTLRATGIDSLRHPCRGCLDTITEIPYDIPAQRFDETAQALAHATGCFIETDLAKTGSVRVNAVKGKMSIRDAIRVAIKGTKLQITEEKPDRLKVEIVEE
ncbi:MULTISPECIES: hypothetical protein [Butyricimonas]|uniref:hypothetical protein n=1 Tax=Butyricimonas TaxID=574697 RepID=UPI0022E2E41F|nr:MULTISPECIES: hypothetical protein [Butyricimonas]